MIFKHFTPQNKPTATEKQAIIEFLFEHLEQFGDPKADIEKCLDFALKESESFGGFIVTLSNEKGITCAVVINQTGMKDYIPENILVYIATHKHFRGQGFGKQLMSKALKLANGSVALHVEPDNPARKLYEKLGFTSKYIEMRYKKVTA